VKKGGVDDEFSDEETYGDNRRDSNDSQ